jgi:NRAMP (natural resistance-associated macrophage protein)-like metal ion transporter
MSSSAKALKKVKHNIDKTEHRAYALAKSMLSYKRFNRTARVLGPGIVTGAADDDPSGIATYSQAGALYGFGLLWAFPFMFPLLVAVQESCARIGAVTGKGLAAVIRDAYGKKLLIPAVLLVVVANIINIAADIGAMAATAQLLVPFSYSLLAIFFASVILLLELFVKYKTYTKILKWLALALLAYPITAIIVGQDWSELLKATLTPSISFDSAYIFILVGMLGTTISPYLFFWDTSEIVEDEISHHRLAENAHREPKISKRFIKNIRIDNFIGMAIASIAAWFIVVTAGSVLNSSGITEISSAADAARAIEPLVSSFPNAGLMAKFIFSVGVIGLGLLAVPVLAGSSSYAISEAFGWKEGMHRKFKKATAFYLTIAVATLIGLLINLLGIDPIKALIFAAVFNAIAAIPLLFMIAKIGNSSDILGDYKNGWLANAFVRLSALVMTIAGLLIAWQILFN